MSQNCLSKTFSFFRRFLNNTVITTLSQNSRVDKRYRVTPPTVRIPATTSVKNPVDSSETPPPGPTASRKLAGDKPKPSSKNSSRFKQCLKLFAESKKAEQKKLETIQPEEAQSRELASSGGNEKAVSIISRRLKRLS